MRHKRAVIITLSLALMLSFASAHSGGTDSDGGHAGSQPYHYHHGYSAHDHRDNGKTCPILYDEGYDEGYEKYYKQGRKEGRKDAFTSLLPFPISLLCATCVLAFLTRKLNQKTRKEQPYV